jgi:ParB-like chromosome segregation protein Spo0J
MTAQSLFPSRLGPEFAHLHPKLQWVHSGASRDLRGTVTVQRGNSVIAKILGVLTSLPPTLENAPIRVQIDIEGEKQRWTRTYVGKHRMTSTLVRQGDCLVEQLGPASFTFRLVERAAGIDWRLEQVSMMGIPLPASWFQISARVDLQNGRYHFLIDSALRGLGRIVCYEGLLDVGG